MKEQDKIRVAQIIGKLAFAGVEAVVNNYYRHMDHNQFQFDYYIDDDSESEPSSEMIAYGARYYTIPSSRYPIKRIRVLTKLLKQNPPQIVHSHMNSLNAISLYAAKKANIPVRISHSHSTSNKQEGLRAIVKDVLRKTGAWFATDKMACGDQAGRWLFGDRAMNAGNVFILRNAIDTQKYQFKPDVRQRLRKELNIEGSFVLGHVGRFMKQKNHEFLIRMFADLKKNKEDAVLLLVGDGELRSAMEQLVHKLNLQDSVVFLGNRKDVKDLYNAMDVFVLPSLYEGVPVVGIEAQANGLPCILSDHVSEEIKISGHVWFLSLNESVLSWTKTILDLEKEYTPMRIKNNDRSQNTIETMSTEGTVYNIIDMAVMLKRYYQKVCQR